MGFSAFRVHPVKKSLYTKVVICKLSHIPFDGLENNREQKRKDVILVAVISNTAKIGCSYKDLRGASWWGWK